MQEVKSISAEREEQTPAQRTPALAEPFTQWAQSTIPHWDGRAILIGLMVPMGMTVLNMSMFGVAVPSLRSDFAIPPDFVAWLVTAYTLPFVLFMPLYGRLGDGLGKRRLFMVGIAIFFAGSLLALFAGDLRMLVLGRIVQGVGTAGVNPLCIALISDLFPGKERGKALGTWSSTGPATAMIAPFLGGFLVERLGWRAMFIPALFAAPIALYVVRRWLPNPPRPIRPGFLRHFDWLGLLLLGGATVSFIFYLSSRPITGVEPLKDWRLLALMLLSLSGFVLWEKRHPAPLIELTIFARRNFSRASLGAMGRMFLMSTDGFLIPLYFTDMYGLSPQAVGLLLTAHACCLLITTRLAGQLADRGNGRRLVVTGFALQATMMTVLALLPAQTPVVVPGLVLALHGLSAGLSLAVLAHFVMGDVPPQQSGAAAGLYSMVRFAGSILGTTLGGVILQQALAMLSVEVAAYQAVFWFMAMMGLFAVVVVWKLR